MLRPGIKSVKIPAKYKIKYYLFLYIPKSTIAVIIAPAIKIYMFGIIYFFKSAPSERMEGTQRPTNNP